MAAQTRNGVFFHRHDGASLSGGTALSQTRRRDGTRLPLATAAAKRLAALPVEDAFSHGHIGRADARPSHIEGIFIHGHDGVHGQFPTFDRLMSIANYGNILRIITVGKGFIGSSEQLRRIL